MAYRYNARDFCAPFCAPKAWTRGEGAGGGDGASQKHIIHQQRKVVVTYPTVVWVFICCALVFQCLLSFTPTIVGKRPDPITIETIVLLLIIFAGGAILAAFYDPANSSLSAQRVLSDPSTFFLAIMLSIYFYWLRGRAPLVYGTFEVAIGVLTIALVLFTANSDVLARLLGVLGGSYIIVRGLDNMDRGCTKRMRKFWDAVFPKRASEAKV